jgi:hypothetical protein
MQRKRKGNMNLSNPERAVLQPVSEDDCRGKDG